MCKSRPFNHMMIWLPTGFPSVHRKMKCPRSARKLPSSARLSLVNFSFNSSPVNTYHSFSIFFLVKGGRKASNWLVMQHFLPIESDIRIPGQIHALKRLSFFSPLGHCFSALLTTWNSNLEYVQILYIFCQNIPFVQEYRYPLILSQFKWHQFGCGISKKQLSFFPLLAIAFQHCLQYETEI